MQNLVTVTSDVRDTIADAEIERKIGHLTLTTPLWGWSVIFGLGYNIVNLLQNLTTLALAITEISL